MKIIFFVLFFLVYPVSSFFLKGFGSYFSNRFPEVNISFSSFSYYDFFVVAFYLLLLALFSFWLACIAELFMRFKCRYFKRVSVSLSFIFIFICIVFVLEVINGIEFPGSSYKHFEVAVIGEKAYVYLGTIVMTAIGLGLISLFRFSRKEKLYGALLCAVPLLLLLSNICVGFYYDFKKPRKVNSIVYIVGVDAVRADAYDDLKSSSKYISRKHKAYLNSYTPVGRTYASWNVLTTGEKPQNNGVRFNLSNRAPKCTMFKKFSQKGWNIIYGSDEKRFNHIGINCGLDNNVGASAQALDFIGASPFFDYPMFNLLTGYDYLLAEVMPFHIHNRANYVTYDPVSAAKFFSNKIGDMLTPENNLVVFHLTLPHLPWEHRWYNHSGKDSREKYAQMVLDVGPAIDELMGFSSIESNSKGGVIWSDHGESFSNAHSHGKYCCGQVSGHGTSVKDIEQYKVFISFSSNIDEAIAYSRDSFITTMDIFPTLSYKYLDENFYGDGCNLLDKFSCNGNRELVIETGYTLDSMLKAKVNVGQVFEEGFGAYQITNGRVSLRPEFEDSLLLEKKYNVVRGEIFLKD